MRSRDIAKAIIGVAGVAIFGAMLDDVNVNISPNTGRREYPRREYKSFKKTEQPWGSGDLLLAKPDGPVQWTIWSLYDEVMHNGRNDYYNAKAAERIYKLVVDKLKDKSIKDSYDITYAICALNLISRKLGGAYYRNFVSDYIMKVNDLYNLAYKEDK